MHRHLGNLKNKLDKTVCKQPYGGYLRRDVKNVNIPRAPKSTTSQGGMPKNRIQTRYCLAPAFQATIERLCTAQSLPAKKITEAKKMQPKTLLAVCVSPRSGLHLPREKDNSFKPSCRHSCTPDCASFIILMKALDRAHPLCLLFTQNQM